MCIFTSNKLFLDEVIEDVYRIWYKFKFISLSDPRKYFLMCHILPHTKYNNDPVFFFVLNAFYCCFNDFMIKRSLVCFLQFIDSSLLKWSLSRGNTHSHLWTSKKKLYHISRYLERGIYTNTSKHMTCWLLKLGLFETHGQLWFCKSSFPCGYIFFPVQV